MPEQTVAAGKVVSITYVMRNARDDILEARDLPVSYLHGGEGELFPQIEQALEGCRVGERVAVTLTPEESFGAHDPTLTFTDDLANVPEGIRYVGAEFEMENAQGESRAFVVTRIEDGSVTVDCNHPLAGQTLRFAVTVAAIRDATPEEMRMGIAAGADAPTAS
jgi:FKBP-type peptidyl-prolyl cis-trans isomerase SlyD